MPAQSAADENYCISGYSVADAPCVDSNGVLLNNLGMATEVAQDICVYGQVTISAHRHSIRRQSPYRASWQMLTVLALALAFLSGCDESSSSPKAPGTTGQSDPDTGLKPYASWTSALSDLHEEIPVQEFPPPPVLEASNQTIRQVVSLSLGGKRLRIRFSNRFGNAPVHFEQVRVAISPGGTWIDTDTDTAVTFGGETSISIPAGADIWSDDAPLTVAADSQIAVSVFVLNTSPTNTAHRFATANTFIASGNATRVAAMPPLNLTLIPSTFWIQEIDVLRSEPADVVVAFGDSLTVGGGSTWAANHRYPNFLSAQLPASVVNAGLTGNRWLEDGFGPSGLNRFHRDVLAVTGVTHCIVLLGINDIGFPKLIPSLPAVTAEDLIEVIESVALAANAADVHMLVATLPPFSGSIHYSAAGEQTRQQVNAWIRAQTNTTGVVDFDLALRDPEIPSQLRAAYDSGDHLHPNDDGYWHMAELASLALGSEQSD